MSESSRVSRRHRLRPSAVVGFAAIVACSAHAQSTAEVLAQAREASGGPAWSHVRALEIDGREFAEGLQGDWRSVEDLQTGRFAQASDFGIFRTADIFDGRTRWRVDRSGGVHPLDADYSRRNALTDAWLTRRAYLRGGAEGAAAGPTRQETEGGRHFVVATLTPRGGNPVEFWFDASTHLPDRLVRELPVGSSIQRLSEYRRVSGVMLPFHIAWGDPQQPDEDTVTVTRYTVNAHIGSIAFARPLPPRDSSLSRTTVIAAEAPGYIEIEATLNGKGPFVFILDTGGHNIITPAVAAQLGLVAVGDGHSGGAGEGQQAEQDVRVARLAIGDAAMTDQHFYVIPLSYDTIERGSRPPLAGILGLEVFERFRVTIDYPRLSVALSPFSVPDPCKGTRVPIHFDDDIPLADGRIDDVPGVVAVDTGNGGSTVVQGLWAQRVGLAEQLKKGVATVSFGAGGASYNWASRGHTVALNGAAVTDTELRYAQDKAGSFSSRTEAANAGHYFLANFRVGFDYSRNKICLESVPGYVPPPMNRSGLGWSKDEQASFTVVQVRAESPAAGAGILRGDKLVAVDGTPATAMSGDDLSHQLRRSPGTLLHLQLLRADKVVDVDLVLQDPF
jgi:hypothetical protein